MIGIIGAMEKEVKLLRGCLENPNLVKFGEFEFYTGKLEGKEIALLQCGIGKVNAAVGCSILIHVFKPDLVVNTGSAGGIADGLRFGDVIISTGLLYHDVDVTAFGYAPGQLPGQPQVFPVSEGLVSRAAKALGELKEEGVLPPDIQHCRGFLGSGDTFMHRPGDITELRRLFPDVAAVEMEGAAVAHCCKLFSVPALVIRALSDIAGSESPVTFDEFLPIASKHSAEIVRRIVRNS
ncbi:MAG: 5'-methylthioadenosine/S-adenosylhomocysteine nucleosidase [Treponema sp.]|nr:5'-methylthioadenosine/S-adenosylhomocysteine nucleosidase [Treponema sp.]